jgi:hypothetical protein
MELPPEAGYLPGRVVRLAAGASHPSLRLAAGLGTLYGLVGGLLGALQVLGTALAISLNQQQIVQYENQYAAYRDCLRTNPTPILCQQPTSGVLAVTTIWLLFLGTGLAAFVLSQVAYGVAARAAAARTHSRSTGVVAAVLAATAGWLFYLAVSVASVLAQASPFTMTAPPLGVDPAALHLGAAIGYAIADALALLPTLGIAGAIGLVGALRVVKRRGTSSSGYVVFPAYGPPPSPSAPTGAHGDSPPAVHVVAPRGDRAAEA